MKLHWGNAIFLFFTIFIGLSIAFIIFSINQDIELVEDDYYNKGANYSNQMKIDKRSAEYDDSISVKDIGSKILLTFPNSISLKTDTLKVHFYNPSSKSKDYKALLSPIADSNFFNKNHLSLGRYIIKMQWRSSGQDYQIEKGLTIQ